MQHDDGQPIFVSPFPDVERSPRYGNFTCLHGQRISPRVQIRRDTTSAGCIKWKALLCQALFLEEDLNFPEHVKRYLFFCVYAKFLAWDKASRRIFCRGMETKMDSHSPRLSPPRLPSCPAGT